jgi:hypothetical protein
MTTMKGSDHTPIRRDTPEIPEPDITRFLFSDTRLATNGSRQDGRRPPTPLASGWGPRPGPP